MCLQCVVEQPHHKKMTTVDDKNTMNRNAAVVAVNPRKKSPSSPPAVADKKRSSAHAHRLLLSSILRVDVDAVAAVGNDITNHDDHNNDHISDALRHRLRIYSIFILATSIFFWIWAVLNTVHLRRRGGGGGSDDGGTTTMMMDLGIISFLGTMVSASCLLRRSVLPTTKSVGYCCCCCRGGGGGGRMIESNDNNNHTHAPPGKCLRTFTILTQLTVVANYVLGILFAFTAGGGADRNNVVYVYFATYCTIFALLWVLAAYVGWVIITVYKEVVAIREVDNEEDIQLHHHQSRRRRRFNGICQQLLQNLLLAAWMGNTHHQSKTERQQDQQEQHRRQQQQQQQYKINYDDDEEDVMDDELLAILKGQGGYST